MDLNDNSYNVKYTIERVRIIARIKKHLVDALSLSIRRETFKTCQRKAAPLKA